MPERVYFMADTDVKEITQVDSTRVDVPPDELRVVVKGAPLKDSPFKDNGKNGVFKSLDSPVPFNTTLWKDGRWEIKESEPYIAMIGSSKVKVLGEKDYLVSKKPSLRVYYIEGSKPDLGRIVLPPESLSGKVETEVVVEDPNLLHRQDI